MLFLNSLLIGGVASILEWSKVFPFPKEHESVLFHIYGHIGLAGDDNAVCKAMVVAVSHGYPRQRHRSARLTENCEKALNPPNNTAIYLLTA
jgi:hypothetical protein